MSVKSSVAATDVPTPRTSGNYNTCGYLATPPIMQMPSASRATAQSRVLLFFHFICASPSAHTHDACQSKDSWRTKRTIRIHVCEGASSRVPLAGQARYSLLPRTSRHTENVTNAFCVVRCVVVGKEHCTYKSWLTCS